MRARPALWWALGAALALSAWALLTPPPASPVVRLAEPRFSPAPSASQGPTAPAAELTPASLDIFAAPLAAAVIASAPAAVPAAATSPTVHQRLQTPAPPTPPAPPGFGGRMVGPNGERLVFLQDGQEVQLAVIGHSTRTGYRIEAITEQAVHLLQPAFDQVVDVAIPVRAP